MARLLNGSVIPSIENLLLLACLLSSFPSLYSKELYVYGS